VPSLYVLQAKMVFVAGQDVLQAKMYVSQASLTHVPSLYVLQSKNSELIIERDQLQGEDDNQKYTIRGLHQQLQAASQSVSSTVKRLEKGFAEERNRLIAVSLKVTRTSLCTLCTHTHTHTNTQTHTHTDKHTCTCFLIDFNY